MIAALFINYQVLVSNFILTLGFGTAADQLEYLIEDIVSLLLNLKLH